VLVTAEPMAEAGAADGTEGAAVADEIFLKPLDPSALRRFFAPDPPALRARRPEPRPRRSSHPPIGP